MYIRIDINKHKLFDTEGADVYLTLPRCAVGSGAGRTGDCAIASLTITRSGRFELRTAGVSPAPVHSRVSIKRGVLQLNI